jgi:hypothetical protein
MNKEGEEDEEGVLMKRGINLKEIYMLRRWK